MVLVLFKGLSPPESVKTLSPTKGKVFVAGGTTSK
jgi:hypothetical protein